MGTKQKKKIKIKLSGKKKLQVKRRKSEQKERKLMQGHVQILFPHALVLHAD